jgi:hypothetical protein
MQLFWQFSIHEQLADWSTFPCGFQFGIVLPSQFVQLWLSFAQQLVGRLTFQGSPYCHVMNIQTRDGLQRSLDVFREFLTNRLKHSFEIVNISNLVSSILLQPGEDFFEPCLDFF